MARVTLDLPASLIFSTELPVRITDINYGDHLGNDALMSLIHEARVRFLVSHGWSEKCVDGPGIIMTDAVLIYTAQVRYGQTLVIDIGLADPTRVGCDVVFKVSDKASGAEAARAKTGIVFFDYATGRVARMPDSFRELFT
ncbi:thioesterase [bacterium]|nr:thioesterase [bacterium]